MRRSIATANMQACPLHFSAIIIPFYHIPIFQFLTIPPSRDALYFMTTFNVGIFSSRLIYPIGSSAL